MCSSHRNNRSSSAHSEQDLNAILGNNVHRMRLEQNLSITCLARMSRLNRSLVTKIEQGASDARLSYVQKLANALCVDPSDILRPHDQQ